MNKRGTDRRVNPRLLSIKESARYLGRSVWSMRAMIWKGAIPFIQDGRKQYIDIMDLDHYIDLHKKSLH